MCQSMVTSLKLDLTPISLVAASLKPQLASIKLSSKVMHHRQKALQSPQRYMCMIIDGMDEKGIRRSLLVCYTSKGCQRTLEMNPFSRLFDVLSINKASSLRNLS